MTNEVNGFGGFEYFYLLHVWQVVRRPESKPLFGAVGQAEGDRLRSFH